MSTTITHDEWTKQLTAILEAGLKTPAGDGPDGFTCQEIMRALGMSECATRKRLRKAIASGAMEFAGKRPTPGIDGRLCSSPVYRIVKKKGGKS